MTNSDWIFWCICSGRNRVAWAKRRGSAEPQLDRRKDAYVVVLDRLLERLKHTLSVRPAFRLLRSIMLLDARLRAELWQQDKVEQLRRAARELDDRILDLIKESSR